MPAYPGAYPNLIYHPTTTNATAASWQSCATSGPDRATHDTRDTKIATTKNGGLQPGGGYDFRPFQHALHKAETPALILFCFTDRASQLKPLAWVFA
jgi:hypothetical protein